MIDGRTVGEVVPGSQSAKEITELWLYVQERLSRIVKDPSLLPQFRPEHLAINSLLAPAMEEALSQGIEAPPVLQPAYDGPERRLGGDRRLLPGASFPERRVFGRRASDLPSWGIK